MQPFNPKTTPEEARVLTALVFQAIAAGWPIAYAKPSAIAAAGGTQRLDLDTNRMVSDAADIAATITQAVDHRIPGESQPPTTEH